MERSFRRGQTSTRGHSNLDDFFAVDDFFVMDDFFAGWVSGVAGLALTQPIDFVLTRLQSGAQHRPDPRGLLGMWRGSMPHFATVPLNNAMLMYGYGVGKSFGDSRGGETLLPVFVGGCAAGLRAVRRAALS